jgi:hypothetical protein
MQIQKKFIGTFKHKIDVSLEYRNLAKEDEEAGVLLMSHQKYRQAVYFFVQAMEKLVRHQIFRLVNPNIEDFRDEARNHELDTLLEFLLRIITGNQMLRDQVRDQLEKNVLKGIRFGKLHNDVRYPAYFKQRDSFSLLQIDSADAEQVYQTLQNLKPFLEHIDKLK